MLTPQYEEIQNQNNSSIYIEELYKTEFDGPYHFHPQFELTYIEHGAGQRFIGSNMESFTHGDLVLVGNNLPHKWKNDNSDYQTNKLHAIFVQFSNDIFSSGLLLPEFMSIQKLLINSNNGISFQGKIVKTIARLLQQMLQSKTAFNRIILLFEILQLLSKTKQCRIIDKNFSLNNFSNKEIERRNIIFAFLLENFRQPVTLKQAANIANLTPTAFCKYFKKLTKNTFFEYLINYRLQYACELLINSNLPIAQVCYDSGFVNFSHFNKMFHKKFKITPLKYRQQFTLGIN